MTRARLVCIFCSDMSNRVRISTPTVRVDNIFFSVLEIRSIKVLCVRTTRPISKCCLSLRFLAKNYAKNRENVEIVSSNMIFFGDQEIHQHELNLHFFLKICGSFGDSSFPREPKNQITLGEHAWHGLAKATNNV